MVDDGWGEESMGGLKAKCRRSQSQVRVESV